MPKKKRSLEDGYNPLDPAPFIENNPSFKYYTDNINPIYVDNNTGEVWQNNKPKGSIILPDVEIKGRALKHSERKEKYPQEKGLETPMIDPLVLLVGGGKFSGDLIGDLIGAGIGRASKPLTNYATKKLKDFGNYVRSNVYYNVAPIGYDHPIKRGMDVLKGIISGKKIDIENAPWINELDWDKEAMDYYIPTDYFKQARIDAWRMYNHLPQKYNTFIPSNTTIGAYQPNLQAIKNNPNIDKVLWHNLISTRSKGIAYDIVNGSGGRVGDIQIDTFYGDPLKITEPSTGIMRYSDIWDLHPFSRKYDSFTDNIIRPITSKIAYNLAKKPRKLSSNLMWGNNSFHEPSKLTKTIANTLYNIGDNIEKGEEKLTSSKLFKRLDDKMKKFEIGSITGGKPFKVVTEIPFHRPRSLEVRNGKLYPPRLRFGFDEDYNYTAQQKLWKDTRGKELYIKRNGGIYKPFYK